MLMVTRIANNIAWFL